MVILLGAKYNTFYYTHTRYFTMGKGISFKKASKMLPYKFIIKFHMAFRINYDSVWQIITNDKSNKLAHTESCPFQNGVQDDCCLEIAMKNSLLLLIWSVNNLGYGISHEKIEHTEIHNFQNGIICIIGGHLRRHFEHINFSIVQFCNIFIVWIVMSHNCY